jgi:integrase
MSKPHRRSYGSGSLSQRPDSTGALTWYGHVRVNGRRRKRAFGRVDAMTKREAEAALRALADELASEPGAAAAGEVLDIAELGRRYLELAERRGRKPSTIENVESEVRVHLVPFFEQRSVAAITTEDVADLVLVLEDALAPKTVRNVIGTLSALLNFARKRGWIAVNPCNGAELPVAGDSEAIRFLTVDELDALIAHARPGALHELDRLLYLVAAKTGLRRGELLALRWADVSDRVRVRSNYVRYRFGTPKSRRSTRSVPLAGDVAEALEVWFKRTPYNGDDDLVFTLDGEPLYATGITRRMHKALRAASLDDHVFHDLRHTFGTRMAAAGVPMRTLQEWMGHRSITTTQRYADYAPCDREAELVAAAFARHGDNVVTIAM